MNDLHDSYDSPPHIPIITGPPKVKKKEKKPCLKLSNTAVAFCYGH